MFVRRRDDRETYDAVFDPLVAPAPRPGATSSRRRCPTAEGEDVEGDDGRQPAGEERRTRATDDGIPMPCRAARRSTQDDIDGHVVGPGRVQPGELLRHRDFDRMTPAELRDAERLVDLLEPRLELRRTRRYELHHHGRLLAPRDVPAEPRDRRPAHGVGLAAADPRAAPDRRPLRHHGLDGAPLPAAPAVRPGVVGGVVGQDRVVRVRDAATRVTRLLKDRDRDRALARVADAVNDWAGGTRIGESFREFNLRWARRTLRTSGVVIVVSDGWDRGDPMLVATETARLRRNCHRLDLAEPARRDARLPAAAGGMRAAFPYIDDFLPAGTVASLERLGEILAGVRTSDVTRQRRRAAMPRTRGRHRIRTCRRRWPDGARPTVVDPAAAATIAASNRPCRRGAQAPSGGRIPMRDSMKLSTLDAWQASGRGRTGGRRPHVRQRAAARRAVLLRADDGRIAGSVSGGCVEGAAAEEIERARATATPG